MSNYVIDIGNVFYVDNQRKLIVGASTKTETTRVNDTTVEDTVYTFDLSAGAYVRQSSTQRTDEIPLDDAKSAKLAELDATCSQTILNGFDYTINGVSYHFDLSISAQANFTGAKAQFKDGKITSVRWTVLNNLSRQYERIDIDELTFNALGDEVFNFIDSNIRKLRDTLGSQVNAATTVDAVNAIVW